MQKTKLSQLLRIFDAWEIYHLKDFVASPFFNKRKDLIQLLNFYLNTKNDKITKPELFGKVFPDMHYDEKKMNNLVSDLFKLTEQFLAYREILENDTFITLNIAKAYRKKDQPIRFKKAIEKGKKQLEKQPLRDRDYLLLCYNFEFEYFDFLGKKIRTRENNLQEMADIYDTICISEKLKQFCFQASHQNVFNTNYRENLKNSILELLEKQPNLLNVTYLHIYYLAFKLIDTEQEEYFRALCKNLQEQSDKFHLYEKENLYRLVINWCIRKVNGGFENYVSDAFELYKQVLKEKIFIDNKKMSSYTFANIVTFGINLNELEWVENFLKNYSKYLPKEIRQNEMFYHAGVLKYKQKQLKKAKHLLLNFTSKDYLMNVRAKVILIRVYFELEEYDSLDPLIESVRVYLKRKNKLAKIHFDYYNNFIKYCKKLLCLKPGDEAKREFKEKIMTLKNPSSREWFISQIEKS